MKERFVFFKSCLEISHSRSMAILITQVKIDNYPNVLSHTFYNYYQIRAKCSGHPTTTHLLQQDLKMMRLLYNSSSQSCEYSSTCPSKSVCILFNLSTIPFNPSGTDSLNFGSRVYVRSCCRIFRAREVSPGGGQP